jgi:hypothetical protein
MFFWMHSLGHHIYEASLDFSLFLSIVVLYVYIQYLYVVSRAHALRPATVLCMHLYGTYIYAGTVHGRLLKSRDRLKQSVHFGAGICMVLTSQSILCKHSMRSDCNVIWGPLVRCV